jgi:glycosyltransferase involved in cell wall biosynthesis
MLYAGERRPKRFSVIMPTYNRKKLLKLALASVLKQDYPKSKFEIIVVNDGSTDGTKEYLASVVDANKDVDIRIINSEKNQGIARSRNLGIRNSSGEIIASIDDDCEAANNWLKTLDGVYSSKPVVISVGVSLLNAYPDNIFARFTHSFHIYGMNTGFITLSNLEEISEKFRQPEVDTYIHGSGGGHSSYRWKMFDEIGLFDERIVTGEDGEINIRFHRHYKTHQMYFTPRSQITHHYRRGYKTLLKQFFDYGRGGCYFRKIRAPFKKGKPLWCFQLQTLKFIISIPLHAKRNSSDLPVLLFIAITTNASMLAGEAYETIRQAISGFHARP